MQILLGRPDDLDLMLAIRREAASWLASKGYDQWAADWPDTETMIRDFGEALARGETWFAVSDDRGVLGVVTVNDRCDPGLWTPSEVNSALFVHRMTVCRAAAGCGLGRRLLNHAAQLARRADRRWLRLDCWTTNTDLHRYYLAQGFRHVRTVPNLDSPSTACFEREVPGRAVTTQRVQGRPHITLNLSSSR